VRHGTTQKTFRVNVPFGCNVDRPLTSPSACPSSLDSLKSSASRYFGESERQIGDGKEVKNEMRTDSGDAMFLSENAPTTHWTQKNLTNLYLGGQHAMALKLVTRKPF
jgi:hypothetical protein